VYVFVRQCPVDGARAIQLAAPAHQPTQILERHDVREIRVRLERLCPRVHELVVTSLCDPRIVPMLEAALRHAHVGD
jgi:hypothetical protein